MSIESILVLPIKSLDIKNREGTKLILKTAPDDPSPLNLGFVVSAPSIPRWMSSEFGAALQEHLQPAPKAIPDADLNFYSHDWIEKITFISGDELYKKDPAAWPAIESWHQNVVNTTFDHPLSTGCSTAVPRTRLRKIVFSPNDGSQVQGTTPFLDSHDNDVFYAVASKYDSNIVDVKTPVAEITVAKLADRPNFVSNAKPCLNKTHTDALANCYALRHQRVLADNMTKKREIALNAVKAFQGAP